MGAIHSGRDLQDFNYLCDLSSQSCRTDTRKRQRRRAIRAPRSTEAKLLFDLQPDKNQLRLCR